MRAGGCTVQQALTAEAASVVKQAVNLARRRGHAQVTPLHVANTMLSSTTGLLRTACLQSHSHPLQCKALELCFNVALNRLPASTSSPMLGHHSHHPSLSNALVAAFKRAQAQQRRGSIENQQQPLLAVKVEIEQLIISILDDPSVSRVMREAGFSSTQVKTNVEQAISNLEICSPNSSKSNESNLLTLGNAPSLGQFGVKISQPRPFDHVRNEDVMSVIETLMNRRRTSSVVVGECLASAEGVVRGVMDKVDKGDVPETLRDVQFISLPLFSFGHLQKEEVEQKMGEVRRLVKNSAGTGAVLYLGDLKWAAEFRASSSDQARNYYCPVEHMIIELGRLVSGYGDKGRFWLLGIATFHTYMRCRIGNPSLETVWGLHPLTIPAGSLGLSLCPDSDSQGKFRNKNNGDSSCWPLLESRIEKQLTCCADCSVKFETEARSLVTSANNTPTSSSTSNLPSWLQQYKNESNKSFTANDQDPLQVRDLCKKWNSICNVVHHHPSNNNKTINFSSISPSSSTSISSYDQHYPELHQNHLSWLSIAEPNHSRRKQQFWMAETTDEEEPDLRMSVFLPNSNPNSTPNSASSSSEAMETEYCKRFKEVGTENLKILCNALEEKVPWQKDIIPEIASTILQCRSGMIRRKDKAKPKEETWFFFQGTDVHGKEKIARELASLIFGSSKNYLSIGLSSFSSSPRADSMEDLRNKRGRDESSCSYLERLAEAITRNPHRVFLVEDIEQVDYCSQLGFKRAIERGTIMSSNGDEVCLSDAIIILSCESFSSRSRACSPSAKIKLDQSNEEEIDEETSPSVSLDLNLSAEEDNVDDQCIDDIGLLESVDRQIVFNMQDL
ncbi:hypothetical protein ACHQM5_020989 [Ranunculus cassubicifolius]